MNPPDAYFAVKHEMEIRGLVRSTSTRLYLTEGLNMDGDNFKPKESTLFTSYSVIQMPNSLGNIALGIPHVDDESGLGPHIAIQFESATKKRYATMYFNLHKAVPWEVDISPLSENRVDGLDSIKEEGIDLEEGVKMLFDMIRLRPPQ